jgi:putative nucleotidyltransferase with HDIG domain
MKPLAKLQHGDPVDGVFLVVKAIILTSPKRGAEDWRGLSMTVTDGTTPVKVFLGKVQGNADLMQFYGTWKTVRVVGKGKQGQDGIEITADEIRYEKADPDALTPKALRSAADYEMALNSWIGDLSGTLAMIVDRVFSDDVRARFFRIPASQRKHHATLGGLAQHTIEVTSLAAVAAGEWTALGRVVNRELCIAGALLHDIGKTVEFAGDGFPATVGRGGLCGHIYAGANIVENEAEAFTDDTLRESLIHIILSHHGKLEYGSPVEPATPEAMIVHMADMQSAWVQAWHEATPPQGELWAKSPICGFVWKGDRYGIASETEPAADAPQLALFDDPKPASLRPIIQPGYVKPAPAADDGLDDPFKDN